MTKGIAGGFDGVIFFVQSLHIIEIHYQAYYQ
jgi:hypothetical protein